MQAFISKIGAITLVDVYRIFLQSVAYCWRSLSIYSLPLTKSSDSVSLNLRSRGFEAKETIILSSSLSSHTGIFDVVWIVSSLEAPVIARASSPTPDGPESKKKSYTNAISIAREVIST